MASVRSWLSLSVTQRRSALTGFCKRFYARRSSSVDDIDVTVDRIPSRLRRRLAERGQSVEDYLQIPQKKVLESESSVRSRGSGTITPPTSASSEFPETVQELEGQLKDMAGSASVSSPDLAPELFPSDAEKYQKWDQSKKAFRPRVDPSKTSLILFPGQGSQFLGMGNEVIDYGKARELFEEASAILKYDLLKLCQSGPLSSLNKTVHCQPAVLVSSLAAVEKLQEQNPVAIETCVGTAGFSVGEFAALVFAGVMSFADAVEVVRVRAEAMQQASQEVPSGMMTVFVGREHKLKTAMLAAREYCKQRCGIEDPVCKVANYLYPEGKVIAGHTQALDFVEKHAKTFGIRRTKRLPVSGAFHTQLMSSAEKPVKRVLNRITLSDPLIPVYSNVTASRFWQGSKITKLLIQQITEPVKWEQILHVLYSRQQGEEFPLTYECGPGNQLGVVLKLVNRKAYEKYTDVGV